MANTIGYARVPTEHQTPALQQDGRRATGGAGVHQKSDMLLVRRLDRLVRNDLDPIELVTVLQEGGIEFRSLTEDIDTSAIGVRVIFHVFAALAQMKRQLISEGTKAGLAAARKLGREGGRPPGLTEE